MRRPASEIEKWQSEKLAATDLVHNAGAYRSALILAAEAEPLLNSRMQLVKFLALVDEDCGHCNDSG
jgi:hypothetical protein